MHTQALSENSNLKQETNQHQLWCLNFSACYFSHVAFFYQRGLRINAGTFQTHWALPKDSPVPSGHARTQTPMSLIVFLVCEAVAIVTTQNMLQCEHPVCDYGGKIVQDRRREKTRCMFTLLCSVFFSLLTEDRDMRKVRLCFLLARPLSASVRNRTTDTASWSKQSVWSLLRMWFLPWNGATNGPELLLNWMTS